MSAVRVADEAVEGREAVRRLLPGGEGGKEGAGLSMWSAIAIGSGMWWGCGG